ncbi:Protein of unknown function (DUF1608) [Candidatus Methanoperedens nitroreducens]|uniref:S-layer family duplication domain-containing protein n=1 Tax=Candidatus Methanoperedens nitratireducens TaxID=1392998 RepID=A0A062VE82_9EURY|nr:S-layer protein domain-containing protein [Candidatus Methanoperedens nitroreducens]KCZ73490.1 Protein of unknown function (DUF1608) [Candidatus Methanoperedens nitroreducens]MDJ1422553.1 S-layer protein domain-containing protein [Candidatus Methanoperedens sp.]
MFLRRDVSRSSLLLLFLIPAGAAASDTLLNGTNIYLTTGQSYNLEQGYVLSLKGVSNDGSIWLQLIENNTIVKSEIVHNYGSFVYNKTNRTILSVVLDKVYSGSSEQNLVSLYLYQFIDPDMPAPGKTIIARDTINIINNSSFPGIRPALEPGILIIGIVLSVIIFYIMYKLW